MFTYTDPRAYLRGYLRGRRDAIDRQPAQTDLTGDFAVGYELAYRVFRW